MILSNGALLPSQLGTLGDTTPLFADASYYAQSSLQLSNQFSAYGALYRSQLWVGVVVRKLALGTARMPFDVKRQGDANSQTPQPGPLADLLRKPNDRMSGHKLWLWTAATRHIYGEAFWLKVRDNNMRVRELRPMHPSNVILRRDGNGDLYYVYTNGTRNSSELPNIPADDVVAFTSYNPDSLERGMSNLEGLRMTLLNEDASRRATASFWARGARPSVVLTHPNTVSKPAQERLLAGWNASQAGVDNMGGTALLEEGIVPHTMQLNSEEMQYIESRKLNREEVCSAFDVPPPVVHILDHATYCLPADTSVSTLRGPVAISDVVESDQVFGYDGAGLSLGKVSWSGQTGVKPLFTIRTATRTVQATGNHPFLVARRPWLSGEGARARYGAPEFAYVPAEELSEGDLLVAAHGHDLLDGTFTAPNGRPLTEEFMEFMGIMSGDGSTNPANGIVALAYGDQANYVEHYLHCADSSFTQRGGHPLTFGHSGRATRFTSISAAREMELLGFTGNAHTKRIPEWVFSTFPIFRLAFLRGFFDADGSVDKKGRISVTLCNRELVVQLRELCIGLGVPVTNMWSGLRNSTTPNGIKYRNMFHGFTCSDPGANAQISSWDVLDAARISNGKPFNSRYYGYADRAGRTINPPAGTVLSKITSIMFDPTPVPVYDLTVDELHSFVANGVVVHNSNITEQLRSMYRDTMAPIFVEYESVINHQLVPDFDSTGDVFTRFNMDEVLRGDFENRASAATGLIQNGVLKPSEARPMFGLAAAGDPAGDKLYANAALVPLGSPAERVSITAAEPATPAQQGEVAEVVGSADQTAASSPIKGLFSARAIKGRLGRVSAKDHRAKLIAEHETALKAFFAKQGAAVNVSTKAATADFNPSDWDGELSDLLTSLGTATAENVGAKVAKSLGGSYSLDDLSEWLSKNSGQAATAINLTTAQQIQDAIDAAEEDDSEDAPSPEDAVSGLFGAAMFARAAQIAVTRYAQVSGYATVDAGQQQGATTKTWVTGPNPRASHADMDGETVGIDEPFSDGSDWPGSNPDPSESAGCNCTVSISKEAA